MQRDPIKAIKKKYYNSINIKKIKPFLFWHECIKCKKEYKNELMYSASIPDLPFSFYKYPEGCSHCFDSIKTFEQYLKEINEILPEECFLLKER